MFARIAFVCGLLFWAVGAGASNVSCTVVFEATWSDTTHPDDYPAGAHFSSLIGATHNDVINFWRPGELASQGIKDVAERGAIGEFQRAIRDEIYTSTAYAVISGSNAGSPDVVSTDFILSPEYPLFTMVTMIAPSPDWFVGVYDVLLYENGRWLDHYIELYPWDAGTDSGTTYTSSNEVTDPPQPISLITDGPAGNGEPFGSFSILCDGILTTGFEG